MMSLFSWQAQNLSYQNLIFIVDWIVVSRIMFPLTTPEWVLSFALSVIRTNHKLLFQAIHFWNVFIANKTIDRNCILHFDPLFSVQLLVEASTWKTNIELLPHIKDHMQFKSSVQQKPKNAYSKMPKVFCDIDTPYSMSDRHDHYCIKGIHLFTEICFEI